MRLFLFTKKPTPVPEGVYNVTCSDPRIIQWLKTQNRIKGIPCLWVIGDSFDSVYYDESIDEYLGQLQSFSNQKEPLETLSSHLEEPVLSSPSLPIVVPPNIPNDTPAIEPTTFESDTKKVPEGDSKKYFEPNYDDT